MRRAAWLRTARSFHANSLTQAKGILMWSEEQLLASVLEEKRFAKFYTDMRPRLGPIIWEIVPNLEPEWAAGDAAYYHSDEPRIRLRTTPSIANTWIVAHEIGHLVLAQAGAPRIIERGPWQEVTQYLANIIEDFQIEDILSNYGYPTTQLYTDRAYQTAQAILEGARIRSDRIGQRMLAILMLDFELQSDYLAAHNNLPHDRRALALLYAGYPTSKQYAQELITLARSTGLKSPAAVKKFYIQAIEVLDLQAQTQVLLPHEIEGFLKSLRKPSS